MKSLRANQVHVSQLEKADLQKGEELIDDSQIEDHQVKLVMVGRRVSQEEYERSGQLQEGGGQQHMLSSEIFHESSQRFDESIKKDEGILTHYLRHIYLVFGMLIGVNVMVQAYSFSFEALLHLEDTQD